MGTKKELNPITGLPIEGTESKIATSSEKKPKEKKIEELNPITGLPVGTPGPIINNYFDRFQKPASEADRFDLGKESLFDFTKYDGVSVNKWRDFYEDRAQAQSVGEQLAYGTGRLGLTIGTKFMEGIGFIGGAIGASAQLLTGGSKLDALNTLTDNAMVRLFEGLEEDVKEAMPIHHKKAYTEGRILDQMGTLGFWMDDVVDGLAFMVSAYGPGLIGKSIGLGARTARGLSRILNKTLRETGKATKFGRLTTKIPELAEKGYGIIPGIDHFNMFALQTISEAGFEARDAQKMIQKTLDEKVASGEINPNTGQPWTEYDSKIAAAKGARDTFMFNIAALAPSNLLETRMLLKGFGKWNSLLKQASKGTIKRKSIKELIGRGLLGGVVTSAAEGGYEENIQLAIQDYEHAIRTYSEEDHGVISGVLNNMAKNFSTDEGQKAMALGAIIGFLPGIYGGVKGAKIEDKKLARYQSISTAISHMTQERGGMFIKTEKKPVLDENNEPSGEYTEVPVMKDGKFQVDKEKIFNFVSKQKDDGVTIDRTLLSVLANDKEQFEYFNNIELGNKAYPLLKEEGGLKEMMEILEAQAGIDEAIEESNYEKVEEKDRSGNFRTRKDILKEKKDLVRKFQKIYDNVRSFNIGAYSGKGEEEARFESELIAEQYKEGVNQVIIEDLQSKIKNRTSEINKNINDKSKVDLSIREINSSLKEIKIINETLPGLKKRIKDKSVSVEQKDRIKSTIDSLTARKELLLDEANEINSNHSERFKKKRISLPEVISEDNIDEFINKEKDETNTSDYEESYNLLKKSIQLNETLKESYSKMKTLLDKSLQEKELKESKEKIKEYREAVEDQENRAEKFEEIKDTKIEDLKKGDNIIDDDNGSILYGTLDIRGEKGKEKYFIKYGKDNKQEREVSLENLSKTIDKDEAKKTAQKEGLTQKDTEDEAGPEAAEAIKETQQEQEPKHEEEIDELISAEEAKQAEDTGKKIEKLIEDSNQFELIKVGEKKTTYYRNKKTRRIYKRVSKYILSGGEIAKEWETGTIIGNAIDSIGRAVFGKKEIKYKEFKKFMSKKVYNDLVLRFTVIRDEMINNGETIYAEGLIIHNDELYGGTLKGETLGVAGEVDILTVDTKGKVRIYDFKSMRLGDQDRNEKGEIIAGFTGEMFLSNNEDFLEEYGNKRKGHSNQLNMYRILLEETYGLRIEEGGLSVIPVKVYYEPGQKDTKTSEAVTLPLINIAIKDVKIGEKGVEEILEENKVAKKRTTEETEEEDDYNDDHHDDYNDDISDSSLSDTSNRTLDEENNEIPTESKTGEKKSVNLVEDAYALPKDEGALHLDTEIEINENGEIIFIGDEKDNIDYDYIPNIKLNTSDEVRFELKDPNDTDVYNSTILVYPVKGDDKNKRPIAYLSKIPIEKQSKFSDQAKRLRGDIVNGKNVTAKVSYISRGKARNMKDLENKEPILIHISELEQSWKDTHLPKGKIVFALSTEKKGDVEGEFTWGFRVPEHSDLEQGITIFDNHAEAGGQVHMIINSNNSAPFPFKLSTKNLTDEAIDVLISMVTDLASIAADEKRGGEEEAGEKWRNEYMNKFESIVYGKSKNIQKKLKNGKTKNITKIEGIRFTQDRVLIEEEEGDPTSILFKTIVEKEKTREAFREKLKTKKFQVNQALVNQEDFRGGYKSPMAKEGDSKRVYDDYNEYLATEILRADFPKHGAPMAGARIELAPHKDANEVTPKVAPVETIEDSETDKSAPVEDVNISAAIAKKVEKEAPTTTTQQSSDKRQKELDDAIAKADAKVAALRESDGSVSKENEAAFKEAYKKRSNLQTHGEQNKGIISLKEKAEVGKNRTKYLSEKQTALAEKVIQAIIDGGLKKGLSAEEISNQIIFRHDFMLTEAQAIKQYVAGLVNNVTEQGNSKQSFAAWRKGEFDTQQTSEVEAKVAEIDAQITKLKEEESASTNSAEVVIEGDTELAGKKMYAGSIGRDGVLHPTETAQTKGSAYKLTMIDANNAYFEFNNTPKNLIDTLNSYELIIKPGYEIVNSHTHSAKSLTTVKRGKVKKENGKWVIAEKGKIGFGDSSTIKGILAGRESSTPKVDNSAKIKELQEAKDTVIKDSEQPTQQSSEVEAKEEDEKHREKSISEQIDEIDPNEFNDIDLGNESEIDAKTRITSEQEWSDSVTQEERAAEIRWLRRAIPFADAINPVTGKPMIGINESIPTHILDKLSRQMNLGGKTLHGLVHNAAIYLSSNAEIGTTYHEAFHLIFQFALNRNGKNGILSEAKTRYKSKAKELGRPLTNTELEEELSEEFRSYIMTGGATKIEYKGFAKIINWFKEMWEYIQFTLFNKMSINNLFERIESNKLNYKIFKRNVESFIPDNISKTRLVSNFKQNTQKQAVDEINDMLIEKVREKILEENINAYSLKKILDSRHIDLDKMYNSVLEDLKVKMKEHFIKYKTDKENNKVDGKKAEALNRMIKGFDEKVKDLTTINKDIVEPREDNLRTKAMKALKVHGIHFSPILEELEEEKGRQFDKNSYETDRKLSNNIKFMISMLHSRDANGELVRGSLLGQPERVDFNKMYPNVVAVTVGAKSIKEMEERLVGVTKSFPDMLSLTEALEKAPKNIRAEFESNMKNQLHKFLSVLRDETDLGANTRIINANQTSIEKIMVTDWKESNDLYSINENDAWSINKEMQEKALKKYKKFDEILNESEFISNDVINPLISWLNAIGISGDYVRSNYIKNAFLTISDLKNFTNKKLVFVNDSVREGRNIFENSGKVLGTINEFALKLKEGNVDIYRSSFINEFGNSVYAINFNSFMSNQLGGFIGSEYKENIEKYMNVPLYNPEGYLKSSQSALWMSRLLKSEDARNTMKWFTLSATRADRPGATPKDYQSMNMAERLTLQMDMFFSSNINEQKRPEKRVSMFEIDTFADKNRKAYIQFFRAKSITGKGAKRGDGKWNIEELMTLMRQDMARMNQADQQIQIYPDDKLVEDYHYSKGSSNKRDRSGAAFQFTQLPILNTIPELYNKKTRMHEFLADGTFSRKELEEKHDKIFGEEGVVEKTLNEYMDSLVEEHLAELVTNGIIALKDGEYSNINLDEKGVNEFGGIVEAVEEFILENVIAKNEMRKMLSGDIAFYGNIFKNDGSVWLNTDNFIKRMYQVITPGSESYLSENIGETSEEYGDRSYGHVPEANMAIIKSLKLSDELTAHHENIRKYLDKEGKATKNEARDIRDSYRGGKIDRTDAQRVITLDYLKKIMQGNGEWLDEQDEAFDAIKRGEKPPENNSSVFQVRKTFYFGHHFIDKNFVSPFQSKHATLVLYEAWTKDYPEMDRLRKRMEMDESYKEELVNKYKEEELLEEERDIFNKYKEEGLTEKEAKEKIAKKRIEAIKPLDIVDFDSAVKSGKRAVGDIEALDELVVTTSFTKNERSPQNIPTSHRIPKWGTQQMKMILSQIMEDTEYIFDSSISDFGTISGKKLIKIYHDIAYEKIKRSKKSLLGRLNLIDLMEIEDRLMPKLNDKTISEEEKEELRRANLNFLKALREEIEKSNEDLGMPDNLLDALEIVKIEDEIKGYDFMVPLSFPTHTKEFQKTIFNMVSKEVLTQRMPGTSIVQVADIEKNNRLGFIKVANLNKTGEPTTVIAAEIAVTEYVAKQFGLKIGDDLSKIEPNKRMMVGYRIPTQGKNSMIPLVIAKILPNQLGSVGQLPSEITVQMGSDFDVDKMYLMIPESTNIFDKKTGESRLSMIKYISEDSEKAMNKRYIFHRAVASNNMKDKSVKKIKTKIYKEYEPQITKARSAKNNKLLEAIKKERLDKINEKLEEAGIIMSKEDFKELSILEQNSNQALNNAIISTSLSVLKNPEHVWELVDPLSSKNLDDFKKEMIKRGLAIDQLDLNSPSSIAKMDERNQRSKALVGIYSNFSVLASIIQFTDIKTSENFRFNGKNITEISITSDTENNIKERQNAALDAAKDPIGAYINDNTFTAPVIAAILIANPEKNRKRSQRIANLFVNQPIIRDFTERFYNENATINNLGPIKKFIEEKYAVTKFKEEYASRNERKNYPTTPSLEDDMPDTKNAEEKDRPFLIRQRSILEDFMDYIEEGRRLTNFNKALTTGSDISSAQAISVKEQIIKKAKEEGLDQILTDKEKSKHNLMNAFYQEGVLTAVDISKRIFPYNSTKFKSVRQSIMDAQGLKELNKEQMESIDSNAFLYLFSSNDQSNPLSSVSGGVNIYNIFSKSSTRSTKIIKDGKVIEGRIKDKSGKTIKNPVNIKNLFDEAESINKKTGLSNYPEISQNLFFRSISLNKDYNSSFFYINFNNTYQYDSTQKSAFTESIYELFNTRSRKATPEERKKEEDLAKQMALVISYYAILNNAFQTGPRTFSDLIPSEWIYEKGMGEYFRKQMVIVTGNGGNFFRNYPEQYIRNNYYVRGLVPSVSRRDSIKITHNGRALKVKQSVRLITSKEVGSIEGVKYVKFFKRAKEESGKNKWILYRFVKENQEDNTLEYEQIETLGAPNVMKHYEMQSSYPRTANKSARMKEDLSETSPANPITENTSEPAEDSLMDDIDIESKIARFEEEIGPEEDLPSLGGIEFQLEREDESNNKEVDEIVKKFLTKIGVRVDESLDSLKDKFGVNAVAAADIVNKIVYVAKGQAGIHTLPEEAGHFLVELLGDSHPLVTRMMTLVEGTDIMDQVRKEYTKIYEGDEKRLKKEAVGKVIAEYVVKGTIKGDQSIVKKLIRSIKLFLNKHFGWFSKIDNDSMNREIDNVFSKAAKKILEADVSEISDANLAAETKVWFEKAKEAEETMSEIMKNLLEAQADLKEKINFFRNKIKSGDRTGIKNIQLLKRTLKNMESSLKYEDELGAIGWYVNSSINGINRAHREFVNNIITNKENKSPRERIAIIAKISDIMNSFELLKRMSDILIEQKRGSYERKLDEIEEAIINVEGIRSITQKNIIEYGAPLLADYLLSFSGDTREYNEKGEEITREGEELTREKLIKSLKLSLNEESTLQRWLNPLISSHDAPLALFAKAVKEKLHITDIESTESRDDILDVYMNLKKSSGISFSNPEEFNADILEEVGMFESHPDEMEMKKQLSFVQLFDMNKFEKNKMRAFDRIEKDIAEFEEDEKVRKRRKLRGKWYSELDENGERNTVAKNKKDIIITNSEGKSVVVYEGRDSIIRRKKLELGFDSENEEGSSQAWMDWAKYNMRKIGGVRSYQRDLAMPNPKKYKNQKWDKLINDKTDKGIYFRELLYQYFKAQEVVPVRNRNKFILPSVYKDRSLASAMYNKGVVEGAKELIDKHLKETERDRPLGLQSLGEKGEVKSIPIYYTGDIKIEDVSRDAAMSVILFTQTALKYKNFSEMEAEVSLMQDIIGSRKVVTKKHGKALFDAVAEKMGLDKYLIDPKAKGSRSFDHLSDFINMIYYGEMRENSGNLIGGISKDKTADIVLKLTSLNALAFNLGSGISNVTFGSVMMAAEAHGGQFYNKSDWAKGISRYTTLIPSILSDVGKLRAESHIGQLVEKIDPIQGQFRDEYGRSVSAKKAKRLFKMDHLFIIQNGGEHMMQVSTMIAMMEGHKIKDKEGKYVTKDGKGRTTDKSKAMTLWEAYKGRDKKGRVIINKDVAEFFTDKDLFKFKNRIHGLNKRLHGVYNDFDRAAWQKYWHGRAAMQFRKWAKPGWDRRWETRHYDQEMEIWIEGNYRTTIRFVRDLGKGLLKLEVDIASKWNELSPMEKANVKRTIVDVGAMAATWALLASYGYYDDDDNAEKTWADYTIMYQARRLQAELLTYAPPFTISEGFRILKSPAASVSTIEKILRLLNRLVTGIDDRYKRRTGLYEKGDLKIIKNLNDILPVINQYKRVQTPRETLKWFQGGLFSNN